MAVILVEIQCHYVSEMVNDRMTIDAYARNVW